jgi:microcystin-dependent protein
MDPYIGEIRAFGFNFAARDWAFCNGQTMAISQNQALFSIIGTIYGGNGTTTFQLPNLQGQVPMHWGNGPGGLNTTIGEMQGTSSVTLTAQQIPQHNHVIQAAEAGATSERVAVPTNQTYLGNMSHGNLGWSNPPANLSAQFAPNAISMTGSSFPHDNMQPYLTINFLIALYGIFPSRN